MVPRPFLFDVLANGLASVHIRNVLYPYPSFCCSPLCILNQIPRITGRVSCCNIRPYRFYCRMAEGENELRVETTQQESSGLPISGYVKVGKLTEPAYKVRLHYGKACVFVGSNTPESIKLTAKLLK